jgi:hypothetical protein
MRQARRTFFTTPESRGKEIIMTNVTGGQLLARAVANEGIKFVFGLPCPEIDPFLAALDANDIRFLPIRHESAGVHLADRRVLLFLLAFLRPGERDLMQPLRAEL